MAEVKDFEYPPNYQSIRDRLSIGNGDILFAYYPYIYNPSGKAVYADLMMHEDMHIAQQEHMGVEKWWAKYLDDSVFRYEQELMAFAVQYAYGLKSYPRKISDKMLSDFSIQLANGIYGNNGEVGKISAEIRFKARTYNSAL